MSKTDGDFCYQDGVSLQDYFNVKIRNIEKQTIITAHTLEKRLDGMNEFRDALKDQASKFITRDELEVKMQLIEKGKRDNISLIISFLAISIAIVNVILKK